MAQRTHVLLIDDLDGSEAEETITFGLDGSNYEIDLSAANAEQLRKSLADYVTHGRKASIIRANSRRRVAAADSRRSTSAASTADVRAWARENGYAVNDRGRISTEVLDAYRAAH